MISSTRFILWYLEFQGIDNFIEKLSQSNNKYLIICGFIIAALTIFTKAIGLVDKVVKGLKKIKKWFTTKRKEEPTLNISTKLSEEKLMTIENPSGFYVKNENIKGLLKEIENENEKIICVVGPPGVGKTKLVQYLCAEELKEEYKIQVYVDFETINSPNTRAVKSDDELFDDAKYAFNRALGIERNDDYNIIAKYFQTPTLIFIDNYEQVLDNSNLNRRIQRDIVKLFTGNNGLIKIIITSRETIEGANNFEVEGLTNTTVEEAKKFKGDLLVYSAIKLFCKVHNDYNKKDKKNNRKSFSPREFLIIVELCNLVSNLPLGIRLIAVKSVYSKLEDIRKELTYFLSQDISADFGELRERHTNLYNVFRWSFDSLSDDEKDFYLHLTHFQNGFFLDDIPTWQGFGHKQKTKDIVIKLYKKSFIREQDYPGISDYRYEVYNLFKELLSIQKNIDKISNDTYLETIYKSYLNKLRLMDESVTGKNISSLNLSEVKKYLRLDIENIEFFIEKSQDSNIELAVEMLIKLERVLNEVGPYIILQKLYDPLLEKINDDILKARLLMSKARVVKSAENRENCYICIKEAMSILEEKNEITPILGEVYRIGAYLSSEISRYDLGEHIINKFNKLTDEEKIHLGELNCAFIVLEQAKMSERDSNFFQAEKYFDTALNLMKDYKVQQAKALNQSGLFYWRMGHSEKSESRFKKAIEQYKGIGEDRWILGFKTNLGLLYSDQDRLRLAMDITSEAYEILRNQGPYGWSQINLQNKGRIISRYKSNEKFFKEAESLLLESYHNLSEIGYNESEVLGSLELAELYYKYNKIDEALSYAKKCIELSTENGLDRWMRTFRSWCIKGLVYFEMGKNKDSLKCYKKAEELLITVENNQWLTYKIVRLRYNKLKEMHKAKLISYPWKEFLKEKEEFNIFGYGSLINQYSSKEAINNSEELIPVIGYGVKRILNYDPDDNVRSREIYQDPDRGDEYFGVFNIEYTSNIDDVSNGVMRVVEKDDFENFIKREVGYSLVQIKCRDFNTKNSTLIEAYTLVAPNEFNGRKLVNNNLLPNVPYYKVCREGAAKVSDDFLEFWLDTSFLGDGRNVREWEKDEGLAF